MKSQSLIVTGTDTGIGKTVVAAVLAVGFKAKYWKPIQTGSIEGTDSNFVGKWIGAENIYPESYVFPEPLSPHLAAKEGKASISFRKCVDDAKKLTAPTIIEGAGGVLVPITSTVLMIDLFQALEFPVIVVASTRLGTINHSLLTLESLRAKHIPIAGFITVGQENNPVRETIESFSRSTFLGHVPKCEEFSSTWFQEAFNGLDFSKIN